MNEQKLIEIFKAVSLYDLSDFTFEYSEGEDEYGIYEYRCNGIYNGTIRDAIMYDGNIFYMMNNSGDFSPLNPMKTAFDILYSSPYNNIVEIIKLQIERSDRTNTKLMNTISEDLKKVLQIIQS